MKVKSRMSCPVRRKDGTWTTVIKEFEEDIPDLGREEPVSYTHLILGTLSITSILASNNILRKRNVALGAA